MTVRFKTEYQRSFRSRSASPQRSALFAGLRSASMGISREPCLQRRKKVLRARSCEPPRQALNRPTADAEPSKPTVARPEPEAPAGPRRADGPSDKPVDAKVNPEAVTVGFAVEPQKSKMNSQTQQRSPIDHSLRRKAGLSYRRQTPLQKTEYTRQFQPKSAVEAPSPVLTAQKVLYTSHSAVPPLKINPVAMDTEYRRSFQGQAPPMGPRLRKQQEPLFYTLVKRNNKNLPQKKHDPGPENEMNNRPLSSPKPGSPDCAPSRRHRILTEYESRFCVPLNKIPEEEDAVTSHMPQVKELRDQAQAYRRRAWGTNFSRDHLSQLLSKNNALWEPTESTVSGSDCPQSTRLHLSRLSSAQPDPSRTPSLEALDLTSNSGRTSKKSSVAGSRDGDDQTNKVIKPRATPPHSPPAGEDLPVDERDGCDEHDEHDEDEEHDGCNGDEEGRLPTPKLRLLPVQRTHLDRTTPATAGGAILVGKLAGSDDGSVALRSGTAASALAQAETTVPVRPREAWSDLRPHRPAQAAASRAEQPQSSPPVASNTNVPVAFKTNAPVAFKTNAPATFKTSAPVTCNPNTPLHCIQGTLRHADFQHNGELGLRFKEQKCTGGCCGSDEDDRLSVMSWRSAASCSVASAVLERSLKRRDDFWGKR